METRMEVQLVGSLEWFQEPMSLRELDGRRKGEGFAESFTAIIDDVLYVADERLITLWREDDAGNMHYLKDVHWAWVADLHFADAKVFKRNTEYEQKDKKHQILDAYFWSLLS